MTPTERDRELAREAYTETREIGSGLWGEELQRSRRRIEAIVAFVAARVREEERAQAAQQTIDVFLGGRTCERHQERCRSMGAREYVAMMSTLSCDECAHEQVAAGERDRLIAEAARRYVEASTEAERVNELDCDETREDCETETCRRCLALAPTMAAVNEAHDALVALVNGRIPLPGQDREEGLK